MTRIISDEGIALIKKFEGLRLIAYRDVAGVLTIGYGWTRPVDGRPIRSGMVITRSKAEQLLKEGVKSYAAAVEKACPEATDNQFAAMTSLCYNIGPGNFARSSVAQHHAVGQYKTAADAFLIWNRAGGQVLPGLTRRRISERALYLQPDQT